MGCSPVWSSLNQCSSAVKEGNCWKQVDTWGHQLGCILWEPWMSVHNSSIVLKILQCRPKWWTDIQTLPLAWLRKTETPKHVDEQSLWIPLNACTCTGMCCSSPHWSKAWASGSWRHAVYSTLQKESSHQNYRSYTQNITGAACVLAFQMCAHYEFCYLVYQASGHESPEMSLVKMFGVFTG